MNKEVISSKQATSLVIIYVIGTALILGGGTKAKQDTWISALIALVAALPITFVYGSILKTFPGKNLFEILDIVFGNIIGKIFSVLFIWYFFHLGSLCFRNITEFIQITSLRETPQLVPATFLALLAIYMIKSGVEVFGRWGKFIIVFVTALLLLIFILAIPSFKYENVKPILYNGWNPVISGALSLFAFPFAETVVFLAFLNKINDKNNINKFFINGVLFSGFMFLLTIIKNTFALGYPLVSYNYFPTYFANMIISLEFLQRIEAVSSIVLALCGFAKLCVCMFATCIGISHILKIPKYKDISVPVTFMSVATSKILFSSTMEMMEFIEVYKYYALPFQVFLPILILIVGLIRKRKNNGQIPPRWSG